MVLVEVTVTMATVAMVRVATIPVAVLAAEAAEAPGRWAGRRRRWRLLLSARPGCRVLRQRECGLHSADAYAVPPLGVQMQGERRGPAQLLCDVPGHPAFAPFPAASSVSQAARHPVASAWLPRVRTHISVPGKEKGAAEAGRFPSPQRRFPPGVRGMAGWS